MHSETSVSASTRGPSRWGWIAGVALLASCASSDETDRGAGSDDAAAAGDPAADATGADARRGDDAGPDGTAGDAGGDGAAATCCADGDCLCRGPTPTALTSNSGAYATARFTIAAGTVHYPTDATPPFAAVAICGGYTNTGPEMAAWGTFYASHGIVTVIVTTLGSDQPTARATKLLAAIDGLKAAHLDSTSPLFGAMAGRYGTSGYSLGGGGTTLASAREPSLRTSIGLAPYSGVGAGVMVPTLLLCGQSDSTAPCNMAQGDYGELPGATPKMLLSIPGATHFSWFGPTNAGGGLSGKYALAFQKVFLEGDERWKPLLLTAPGGAAVQTTNIP